MAFGKTLPAVRKRHVELDDEVTVARLVQGPAGALAAFDDPRQRECGELAFGVALLDPGPHGRTLRGVLAERECVKETEPPGIGETLEPRRCALVLFVARALEQRRVAREEVQVPVFDGHFRNRPNPAYDSAVVALLYILRQCRMCSTGTAATARAGTAEHAAGDRIAPRASRGSPWVGPGGELPRKMAHIVASMRRAVRVVWVVGLILGACASPKLAGTELDAIDAPDFTLTDGVSGRAVTLSAQRGQVVALTFLYTTCPDVCPLTASHFRSAQLELQNEASRVTFIAVSVDPDGDTPSAVRTFSAAHGLAANWYYLVGGRAQLAPVWAAYGIGVQAGSSAVTHNDAVYLIDARGRERVLLHSEDLGADLVNDLRALLKG